MLILVALFLIQACFAGTIPGTPENVTVTFLAPSLVRVSWQNTLNPIEKYVVTYKPADDRVVRQVAGNSEAVILEHLSPNTEYSMVITAFWNGKKYRSRQIIFRTLDSQNKLGNQEPIMQPGHHMGIFTDDVFPVGNNVTNSTIRELPPIRGVEIGIVLIVLLVWAGAIALFFNRWGKIRMLLPYQPDYKHEQLKVPGTGVCVGGACSGQHSHQFDGSDIGPIGSPVKTRLRHFHYLQEEPSVTIAERCTRSRINSAIFVSSEGRGFDSIEFLRRHGSQSVLCRKARSAENISDDNRKHQFTENRKWYTEDGSGSSKVNNENISNYNHYKQRQSLPYRSEAIEMAECYAVKKKLNSSEDSNWATFQTETTATTTTIPIITSSVNNSSQVKNLLCTTQSPKIVTNVTSNHISGSHNISAVTTSSNPVIVGSISIETPPQHILLQEKQEKLEKLEKLESMSKQQERQKRCLHKQESVINSQPKLQNKSSSSATTSSSGHSQSPLMSPNSSPVMLNLKNSQTNKTIPQLPTLSVSEPSPPHDENFL